MSFTVTRNEPDKAQVVGSASTPERAARLAAEYRRLPAAIGTSVIVTGPSGNWKPWIYHGEQRMIRLRGWLREPIEKRPPFVDRYVFP